LGAAFSLDGTRITTVCKDKMIRVFDALDGNLVSFGESHEGTKAARVIWLPNSRLCSVGFGKANAREIRVYEANTCDLIGSCTIGTSPSLLIPTYDIDTGLLILAGRGDSFIQFFQVNEANVPTSVNLYKGNQAQQCFQSLPKKYCDVRMVEIINGFRVTPNAIEKVSFTVPRLHNDFFQDDLFPLTMDIETPIGNANDYLNGIKNSPVLLDLKPVDMIPLSQKPTIPVERKASEFVKQVSEREMKESAMKAMFETAKNQNQELEQDKLQGVDDSEWD
jgi:coronin-7